MRSDIEIAQENTLAPIVDVAKKIGVAEHELECYGAFKAKLTMKKCMSYKRSLLQSARTLFW